MRRVAEVRVAEQEMFDRVWINRHFEIAREDPEVRLEILQQAVDAAYGALERYGENALVDRVGLAFLEGKLSTLRWVLGEEWDFLDT